MFGPLPSRYRHTLTGVVIAAVVLLGLTLGTLTAVPLLPLTTAALALPAGVVIAFLLVHDFSSTR